MEMKRGTPGFGILLGVLLVALGALVMMIGFWKTPALAVLFGIGYFLGTVENKSEFMKNAANKLIPDKEAKVIDFKSELAREQETKTAEAAGEVKAGEAGAPETVETATKNVSEEISEAVDEAAGEAEAMKDEE